ncbi:VanW family protein [uncultured Pseudokineococcus sp.]|uniref:VanW family protein n=1 Tax=uncultured Pseudokineococcus sp. TaxID=1642928 RepID=UPI00261B18A6|nr:VanW family protein [uncultured Pseudokineococcus sp.]
MPPADDASTPGSPTEPPTGEGRGTAARRRRWPWGVGAAAVLVLGGYGAAAALTADRVPSGTTVAGVPLGGLDRDEAEQRLAQDLLPRAEEPLAVDVLGTGAEVVPADAGLALDPRATADGLVGFSLDPRVLWAHVADRGEEVAPETTVDDDALAAAVEDLAGRVDAAPVEGDVVFDAEGYDVVAAVPGTALDREAAAAALEEAWPGVLDQAAPEALELPAEAPAPAVDAEAVDAFVASFAEPAVAGPLPVRVGTATAEVPVPAFAPALSAEPGEDGALAPVVDAEALRSALLEVEPDLDAEAQDASLELQDGRPVVVPAVVGRSVAADALGPAALEALAVPPGPERVAVVTSQEVQPERTTADVEALGVTEVIAEFSTPLRGSNAGRLQNVRTAARAVDETLLAPGEVFDLNEVLGRRTAAAGYAEATIISGGRYVESYGGGVSQISTTLYNGAFFAGLELLDHQPHSFYISRYPEGREATLDFNSIDMRFRNDTSTGVLIQMSAGSSSSGDVTVRFWGTDVSDVETSTSSRRNITQPESREIDDDDCIPSTAGEGFTVTVTRTVTRAGGVVHDDRDVVRYDPVPGITCV